VGRIGKLGAAIDGEETRTKGALELLEGAVCVLPSCAIVLAQHDSLDTVFASHSCAASP